MKQAKLWLVNTVKARTGEETVMYMLAPTKNELWKLLKRCLNSDDVVTQIESMHGVFIIRGHLQSFSTRQRLR